MIYLVISHFYVFLKHFLTCFFKKVLYKWIYYHHLCELTPVWQSKPLIWALHQFNSKFPGEYVGGNPAHVEKPAYVSVCHSFASCLRACHVKYMWVVKYICQLDTERCAAAAPICLHVQGSVMMRRCVCRCACQGYEGEVWRMLLMGNQMLLHSLLPRSISARHLVRLES